MLSLLHENMSSSQISSDDDNNNYDEFNSNKSPLCYNSLKKICIFKLALHKTNLYKPFDIC